MRQQKSIYEMNVGETGRILSMDNIDKRVLNRFLDLGIAPNAHLKLINKINFKQLFIIEIDDVEICIRQNDAKKIIVDSIKQVVS